MRRICRAITTYETGCLLPTPHEAANEKATSEPAEVNTVCCFHFSLFGNSFVFADAVINYFMYAVIDFLFLNRRATRGPLVASLLFTQHSLNI